MEQTRTTAVWLSVMLTASTKPLRILAFSSMTVPSALLGGPHSPVTANLPSARIFSRLEPALYSVGGHTGFASSRTILRGPPELLLLQSLGGRLT